MLQCGRGIKNDIYRCPFAEILEWGTPKMQITQGREERPHVGFRAIVCKTVDPQSMCRFVRTLRVLIKIC